jgi:L-lactate dehydrogenase complex protein LldF
MVLVTNEGNSRFCLAATKCHIALIGIEKIVPRPTAISAIC